MASTDNDSEFTDAQLLRRWHEGDKQMGSVLFQRHFTNVQRFFRNKVVHDDIEDLVQQTFLGCLEGVDRFRGDASFRTYLFAIARRRLYSYLRTRDSQQKRMAADFSITSVHDLGMTPSSAVAAAREHMVMLEAMQHLSVERQTLLELFYWEDLPGREIAEVLEVEPTTVRTRLFRARTELKEIFDRLLKNAGLNQSFDIESHLRATGATQ